MTWNATAYHYDGDTTPHQEGYPALRLPMARLSLHHLMVDAHFITEGTGCRDTARAGASAVGR